VGVRVANEQLGTFFQKEEEMEILDLRTIGGLEKNVLCEKKMEQ
jgi:hypothetical protein